MAHGLIASALLFKTQTDLSCRSVLGISEAYTTVTCSVCRTHNPMKLRDRVYNCTRCGFSGPRDPKSALCVGIRFLSEPFPDLLPSLLELHRQLQLAQATAKEK